MGQRKHILLAGLRGSGKTTLGRLLADRLTLPFVDLDDRTARVLSRDTCAQALRDLGEPAFRAGEAKALAQVLSDPPSVVSLGGGTPTAPGARELIKASGALVLYLRLTPKRLAARLAQTDLESRPSLTGHGVIEEIEQLFAQRDPIYQRLGETLDIETEGPVQTLERLVDLATSLDM